MIVPSKAFVENWLPQASLNEPGDSRYGWFMKSLRKKQDAQKLGTQMDITDEQIASLIHRYVAAISGGHHKDRDCHFSIEKTWSYGEPAYYSVSHDGYINQWEGPHKFETAAAAQKSLFDFLNVVVAEEEAGVSQDG